MSEVSVFRLYLMRALYLLIFLGLGSQIWPQFVHHAPWDVTRSALKCLLAALALIMGLGIRYPLQMLPLLLFEFLWKTLWVVAIGLPAWSAGTLDADMQEAFIACMWGVVLCPIVIPWGYVFANYVGKRGDRWRWSPRAAAAASTS